MDAEAFKRRTMALGHAVYKLVQELNLKRSTEFLGIQLLKSATSVGANYRAACRAKSPADFISKLGIVEEEADEVCYWLEFLEGAGIASGDRLKPIHKEADEITAMVVASIRTARSRNSR